MAGADGGASPHPHELLLEQSAAGPALLLDAGLGRRKQKRPFLDVPAHAIGCSTRRIEGTQAFHVQHGICSEFSGAVGKNLLSVVG
jgi:hypothetical protein